MNREIFCLWLEKSYVSKSHFGHEWHVEHVIAAHPHVSEITPSVKMHQNSDIISFSSQPWMDYIFARPVKDPANSILSLSLGSEGMWVLPYE